jgi:hypothetical protein
MSTGRERVVSNCGESENEIGGSWGVSRDNEAIGKQTDCYDGGGSSCIRPDQPPRSLLRSLCALGKDKEMDLPEACRLQ